MTHSILISINTFPLFFPFIYTYETAFETLEPTKFLDLC